MPTLRRTKLIYRMVSLICTLSMCWLLTGCSKTKTLNLMDYASVEFSGIDSMGSARLRVDWDALETAVTADITDMGEQLNAILSLESSIQYSLDKTSDLKNGDTVTLSVSWDKDVAKKFGFTFKGNSKTYTVKDLTVAQEIDLFADVEVDFNGISPNLSVNIRNTSKDPFLQTVTYSVLSPTGRIAEGDTVTIQASFNQNTAYGYGYLPISDTKTYTVENVDKYIDSFDQIPEEILQQMDQQARDVIESKLADKWLFDEYLHPEDSNAGIYAKFDSVEIKSIRLKEYQFFWIKDGISVGYGKVYNSVFMVYEVEATDSYMPDGFIVYLPVYYSDMIICDNGDFNIILTDAVITSAKSNSYDSLYRDTVTYNKANYNYEIIETENK